MKIEDKIKSMLICYGPSYTKDIYRNIDGKATGLSLNKFRKILNDMCKENEIFYIDGDYPKWSTK